MSTTTVSNETAPVSDEKTVETDTKGHESLNKPFTSALSSACRESLSLRETALPPWRNENRINEKRLHLALSDAGRHSQGIVAVEAWVLNSKHTHLVRPEGAWWRDPNYRPSSDLNTVTAMKELSRLEDSSRDDYHDSMPLQPGQGLAGQLWAEGNDGRVGNSISAFGSYHGGVFGTSGSPSHSFRKMARVLPFRRDHLAHNGGMHWINLEFLSKDPDHIPENRVESFIEAGIGQAAGVVFDIRGHQGVVIFFAKTEFPRDVLILESNCKFLISAADCIGATLASSEPRTHALHEKNQFINVMGQEYDEENDEDNASQAHTVETTHDVGASSAKENFSSSNTNSLCQTIRFFIGLKSNMLREKTFGEKKARPPQSMSYSECVWVFSGAIITLVLTLFLSQAILFWDGMPHGYAFPIGPLGALTSLQFGLTAAPAAQPRNVFYGTICCGVTGLCFSYIDALPHWLRLALGGSVAVTLMAKLGVTHPPAGALAVIYATGDYHWGNLPLTLLANVIAVGVAIVVNNLNEKRQYPQYWYLNPFKKID